MVSKSRNTRELIVVTALKLFNDEGTGPVTTNHIAKAAGISPGNLYYHFGNREEIVRELVGRYVSYFDSFYPRLLQAASEPKTLPRVLLASLDHAWRYRFYLRELPSLLRKDEELKAAYRRVRLERENPFRAMADALSETGGFRFPSDPRLVEDLNRTVWLIHHFWISLADLESDAPGREYRIEAVRLTLRAFEPYAAPEVRDEIFAALEEL